MGDLQVVHVLDEDPALGRSIGPESFPAARDAAVAPLLELDPGSHDLDLVEGISETSYGLLVLRGLVARHVTFSGVESTDFVGPRDVMHPSGALALGPEGVEVSWQAVMRSRLAVLDEDFVRRIRPWPRLSAAIVARAAQLGVFQTLQSALHQTRRVEDRVLLALWHFAGRWGEAGPEGRVLHLPVTGEVLARFVGARRQSVSSALGALADRGAIRRYADGKIVLPAPPPEFVDASPGRRAADTARGPI